MLSILHSLWADRLPMQRSLVIEVCPQPACLLNLDQVKIGDCFYIKVMDQVLAYQVDQILRTVLPDDTKELAIVPDEDYVTLITCTPYGMD